MLLFKAIKILMDLDHGMSTAKCIWLLYKITHIIPLKQRAVLLDEILSSKKFYHYFFHWSFNVRMVFYYFYFFQLFQTLMPRKEGDSATGLPAGARSLTNDDKKKYFGIGDPKGDNTLSKFASAKNEGSATVRLNQVDIKAGNSSSSLLA